MLGNAFSVNNTEIDGKTLEASKEVLTSDELKVNKNQHVNKFISSDMESLMES